MDDTAKLLTTLSEENNSVLSKVYTNVGEAILAIVGRKI
jgi:hypothetical protein